MGTGNRKYKGVEQIGDTTVRLSFTYLGRRWRESEKIPRGNDSVVHEALLGWEKQCAFIASAVKAGNFDYASFFPDSKHLDKVQALLSNKKKGLTVGELLMRSYREKLKDHEETGTDEDLRIINREWIPTLGHVEVTELTWLMVKDLILDRNGWELRDNPKWTKNLTHTINNKLSVLRVALDSLVDDEVMSKNVLANKSVPGVRKEFNPNFEKEKAVNNSDRVPFEAHERKKIIEQCNPQQKAVFQFWWWTGIRSGELICLTWKDIKDGRVKITKAQARRKNKTKRVKSKSGNRSIELLPDALEAVEIMRPFTYDEEDESAIIFINPNTGKPWRYNTLQSNLRSVCRKAGVDYKCPYTCRHTFASMWLQADENILELSKIMGHSKRSETIDMYGHWAVSENKVSGSKITKMFS